MENSVKVGDLFHTSWGYDMTHNDFCEVVEVSKTGKTVMVQMVATKLTAGDPYSPGGGRVAPTEKVGPMYRMRVYYNGKGSPELRGSYPFCYKSGQFGSKRLAYFWPSSGDRDYYENHWD